MNLLLLTNGYTYRYVYLHFVNTLNIPNNKHTPVIYFIMIIQLEFKTIELRISSPLKRPIYRTE